MKCRSIVGRLGWAVAVVVGLNAATASANHIDFFEEPAFTLNDSVGGGATTLTQGGLLTGNTLGGRRDLVLDALAGTVTASLAPTDPGVVGDNDSLIFTAADASSQGNLAIVIGMGGDLNANFLDIPASSLDWDRVRVNFGGVSSTGSVTVTLFSDGEGDAIVTKLFGGGDNDLDFFHTEFFAANGAYTAATLRDIDRATLQVNGQQGGSYTLQSFNRNGAVPEPASLALLGLGLLGMAGYARKRRMA